MTNDLYVGGCQAKRWSCRCTKLVHVYHLRCEQTRGICRQRCFV